jgi:hypothetical protein
MAVLKSLISLLLLLTLRSALLAATHSNTHRFSLNFFEHTFNFDHIFLLVRTFGYVEYFVNTLRELGLIIVLIFDANLEHLMSRIRLVFVGEEGARCRITCLYGHVIKLFLFLCRTTFST